MKGENRIFCSVAVNAATRSHGLAFFIPFANDLRRLRIEGATVRGGGVPVVFDVTGLGREKCAIVGAAGSAAFVADSSTLLLFCSRRGTLV